MPRTVGSCRGRCRTLRPACEGTRSSRTAGTRPSRSPASARTACRCDGALAEQTRYRPLAPQGYRYQPRGRKGGGCSSCAAPMPLASSRLAQSPVGCPCRPSARPCPAPVVEQAAATREAAAAARVAVAMLAAAKPGPVYLWRRGPPMRQWTRSALAERCLPVVCYVRGDDTTRLQGPPGTRTPPGGRSSAAERSYCARPAKPASSWRPCSDSSTAATVPAAAEETAWPTRAPPSGWGRCSAG